MEERRQKAVEYICKARRAAKKKAKRRSTIMFTAVTTIIGFAAGALTCTSFLG